MAMEYLRSAVLQKATGRKSVEDLENEHIHMFTETYRNRVSSATVHGFCWSGRESSKAVYPRLNYLFNQVWTTHNVGKQDQIHQTRPTGRSWLTSMDHKQDNVQSLFDEPSEPVSQSPSKYSIGNTEEPEENIHSNPPPPPPSPWKRAALIILICFLFYLGFSMRSALLRDKKHDVIYASR